MYCFNNLGFFTFYDKTRLRSIMKTFSNKSINKKSKSLIIFTLVASFGLVIFILGWGMANNTLESNNNEIIISGMYGESIPHAEIKSIELINKKPALKWRSNGFALGPYKKGYFKNAEGEKFKLFINSPDFPWILITRKNGPKIYFSSGQSNIEELFQELSRESLKQ